MRRYDEQSAKAVKEARAKASAQEAAAAAAVAAAALAKSKLTSLRGAIAEGAEAAHGHAHSHGHGHGHGHGHSHGHGHGHSHGLAAHGADKAAGGGASSAAGAVGTGTGTSAGSGSGADAGAGVTDCQADVATAAAAAVAAAELAAAAVQNAVADSAAGSSGEPPESSAEGRTPCAPWDDQGLQNRRMYSTGNSGVDEYGGSFGVLRGFSQEALVFTRANIRMGWRLLPQELLFGRRDASSVDVSDVSDDGDGGGGGGGAGAGAASGVEVDGPPGSPFWDPDEDEVTVLVEIAVLPGSSNGADRPVRHSVSFEHTFTGVGAHLDDDDDDDLHRGVGAGARDKKHAKGNGNGHGKSNPPAAVAVAHESDDDPPDHAGDDVILPIVSNGVPLVPAAARGQSTTSVGSSGTNGGPSGLRPRAGRMLSSAPFIDNYNNEWTLSLLPYGLADFAPKDLTDKATVCDLAALACLTSRSSGRFLYVCAPCTYLCVCVAECKW